MGSAEKVLIKGGAPQLSSSTYGVVTHVRLGVLSPSGLEEEAVIGFVQGATVAMPSLIRKRSGVSGNGPNHGQPPKDLKT